MAAPVPTPITAIDNLKTTLEAITAGSTYYHTIKQVSKVMMSPEAFGTNNMPGIMLAPDDVNFNAISNGQMTTGSSIEGLDDGWLIAIVGLLNTDTDTAMAGTLTDEMIYLTQDIIVAIANDRTLSDTVINTELISSTSWTQWNEQGVSMGIVALIYSIKFDFYPATSL